MILRGGKEVDNKVSEKKHDKEERSKTNGTDHEIENRASPSPNISYPIMAHKPRAPYPQALNAPF